MIVVAYYESPRDVVAFEEDAVLDLFGIEKIDDDNKKPEMTVSDFCIYDARHRNEMITLDTLNKPDGKDRHFRGVGKVRPPDEYGEDEDTEEGEYTSLDTIRRFYYDWNKSDWWK
jgi:DNA (cytosine-5)-methyltransferase 1